MDGDAEDRKRLLRSRVRAQRAQRSPRDRELASERLSEALISLVSAAGARRVTAYLATPDEPDTGGFLSWALSHHVEVLLPISLRDRTLDWARHSTAGSVPGRHGIREPAGPRLGSAAPAGAELMLIPACAVDETGNRLGWGLGYYDRCLAALEPRPPVYAVVFPEEVLPEVPRDPHDIPITGAVTAAGIRRFPTQTR